MSINFQLKHLKQYKIVIFFFLAIAIAIPLYIDIKFSNDSIYNHNFYISYEADHKKNPFDIELFSKINNSKFNCNNYDVGCEYLSFMNNYFKCIDNSIEFLNRNIIACNVFRFDENYINFLNKNLKTLDDIEKFEINESYESTVISYESNSINLDTNFKENMKKIISNLNNYSIENAIKYTKYASDIFFNTLFQKLEKNEFMLREFIIDNPEYEKILTSQNKFNSYRLSKFKKFINDHKHSVNENMGYYELKEIEMKTKNRKFFQKSQMFAIAILIFFWEIILLLLFIKIKKFN